MAKKIVKKENGLKAPQSLMALFTIVDREKANFYLDILQSYEVNYQLVCYGKGTAPSELISLLGFAHDERAIIISIVKEEHVKEIMSAYEDKYFKLKHGQGIAFTVKMSSMIGKMVYEYFSNMKEEQ